MIRSFPLYAASLLLLLGHPSIASTASVQSEVLQAEKNPELETQSCLADLQNEDGTCKAPNASASTPPTNNDNDVPLQCGLYLAESSIPNAGWGMYTGIELEEGQVIPPVDVVIPVIDSEVHMTYLKHYKRLEQTLGSAVTGKSQGFKPAPYFRNSTAVKPTPKWLMDQYYWDCGMTHNYYDAEHIDSVVPGLGMLANSHPGMIMAENMGPARPPILGGRQFASRTPYQDQSFTALEDIDAGHEIFVEYGDNWFAERFGDSFGLSQQYARGNVFAERWQTSIKDKYYEKYAHKNEMWKDLVKLMLDTMESFDARLHEVVARVDFLDPKERLKANDNPTAYASVPNAPRSLEWLQKEGLCLDHIAVGESKVAPGERGGFAKRDLPKGTVVAPAPVVHMSRDHLTMLLLDDQDADMVLWKGHQLLLNYVYGHPESSLLLFPYAPAVNLLNHYGGSGKNSKERRPNVKLQWSAKKPHPEWLESWTPEEIVQEEYKAGMVMEVVSIEDIAAGDEILLDYGDGWQKAYEEHKATTPPPPELKPIEWQKQSLHTINDKEQYPSYVQTVCWIHEEQKPFFFHEKAMNEEDFTMPEGWQKWIPMKSDYISDTLLCTIVGRQSDGAFYNVVLRETFVLDDDGNEQEIVVEIQNIPRRAVTVVPNLYTSAELRRDGFRHEIELPDEMVPEQWRDLKVTEEENAQCNLYMAESSIENAGWGVYRGYARPLDPEATNELDNFCEDMVIQVEDFEFNQELRNRFFKQPADPEMDDWLLSEYSLSGDLTKGGNLEAEIAQSLTPGCGMLANTHPLLYNAHRMPPIRLPSNTTGPSLGANTHYHNAQFIEQYMKQGKKKIRVMENGNEIFVKTSDNWFQDRVDTIGEVPLRADYYAIDKVLRRFQKLRGVRGDKVSGLLWMLLWNTVEAFDLKAIASALPRDMKDIQDVLDQGGSAKYEVPGRVRSQEWLEEQGSCLDNIRPGKSTVELADNGAFATRKIANGSVIAPVPMIHVHRQHMDIFDSKDVLNPSAPVFRDGKQLLQNYCYGHPKSNLLLFPISPVVNYINHAPSESSNGGVVANAKLQWSSRFNTKEWLDKSPEELLRHHRHAGLAMEVVATRDIAQGEEIFISYGPEWTEAWQKHSKNWKLDKSWNYEPPKNEWLDWMPTEEEIESRNLHLQFDRPDKFLGCHVQHPEKQLTPVDEGRGEAYEEFEWEPAEFMFRTTSNVYPCEIIERVIDTDDPLYAMIRKDSVSPINERYSAVVTVHPGDGTSRRPPLRFISYNMPRRAIEIFDEEYAAPQFYRGAFRHEIGVPDALFPEAWRDLGA